MCYMLLQGILALTEYNVYSEKTTLSCILEISKHSPHNLLEEACSVVVIIFISLMLLCLNIYTELLADVSFSLQTTIFRASNFVAAIFLLKTEVIHPEDAYTMIRKRRVTVITVTQ